MPVSKNSYEDNLFDTHPRGKGLYDDAPMRQNPMERME